jgi:hypothetical protein
MKRRDVFTGVQLCSHGKAGEGLLILKCGDVELKFLAVFFPIMIPL